MSDARGVAIGTTAPGLVLQVLAVLGGTPPLSLPSLSAGYDDPNLYLPSAALTLHL